MFASPRESTAPARCGSPGLLVRRPGTGKAPDPSQDDSIKPKMTTTATAMDNEEDWILPDDDIRAIQDIERAAEEWHLVRTQNHRPKTEPTTSNKTGGRCENKGETGEMEDLDRKMNELLEHFGAMRLGGATEGN